MTVLEELAALAKVPVNRSVNSWKEKGGKVVGFTCSYIPEEILHAGGILPYRLSPTECTDTTEADAYMSHFNCTFARCCLQLALEGKYQFLDGVVMMNSCDHIRGLYDSWKIKIGSTYMHFLSVPHKVGRGAEELYQDEIRLFKENIEEAFAVKITEESLHNSMRVYNKSRALLKKLYHFGERENPRLKGSEMVDVLLAGLRMPREEYNQILEKLLVEVEEREDISGYQARLLLMGGACDNADFIQVIENAGGLVVANTLCFGSRYFWDTVDTEGEPISILAKYYLNRPSCARMTGNQVERWEFAEQMMRRFRIDGIIYQRLKWCDLWGGEAFYLGQKIKELGIPFLALEREYWLSGAEQLKTRVQALLEVIGGAGGGKHG